MVEKDKLTPARILDLAWSCAAPLILESALKLRLFDHIDDKPLTIAELREKTGASQRGLRAIANALVGLNFLKKSGEAYGTTPESSAFLVSTKPAFQGGFFLHARKTIPVWLNLLESVKSGKPAHAVNQQETGTAFFQDLVELLFPVNYAAAEALAREILPRTKTDPVRVLDLAAGSGVWSVPFAQQSPKTQVTAFDWEAVLPVTRRVVERMQLSDRYTFKAGDLGLDDFGDGYHVALLGHILHSEGEKKSRALLKKVFQALSSGGAIAIAEFVPNDERTGPVTPLLFAVNMLLHTDEGDTFTFSEMRGWLKEAGFTNMRTFDAPAVSPLLIATKP